jgi:hypothetical protein
LLRASANLAASPALAAQSTSSFDPQVQSSDLFSTQAAVFHDSQIYSNSSTVAQNNGFYPSLPTHPQYNSSHSSSYPGYGLYTAAMHDARNNFTPSGNDSIDHAAPYGAFNAAATEPTPFSTAHTHNHTHGHDHVHSHVHATERQGTIYFGYPEGDVEGLIVSQNSLNNHNTNHSFSPTEGMMPYNSFGPMEAVIPHDHYAPTDAMMPYDSLLARKNASKAAVLKKDEHKPGQPCPDGHPYCHWHYARWCHEDPVTCRSARKYLRLVAHLIITDSLLQFRQLLLHSMPMEPGKMPRWAGTRYMSPACAQ